MNNSAAPVLSATRIKRHYRTTEEKRRIVEEILAVGVNPEAYLHQVLERIADHPVNRVAELLPWNIGLNDSATELDQR